MPQFPGGFLGNSNPLGQKATMSHEYLNRGSVDMLCDFLGDNTRNYSEKNAFSCVFSRHQLKIIAKGRSSPQSSVFFKDIRASI
jgi:hypothetical protein